MSVNFPPLFHLAAYLKFVNRWAQYYKLIPLPFGKTSVKSTLSVPPNIEIITILSEAAPIYILAAATLML